MVFGHALSEMERRIERDQPATVDDNHAVAHHAHFGQEVGAEDDGVVVAQLLYHLTDFGDLHGVEAHRRRVKYERVGVVQHGLGEAHALAIASG